MRIASIAILAAAVSAPAMADIERQQAQGSVGEAMDRLEAAVTGAGATVFARVDHGAGAEDAGLELADSELLIFGNPQLGTPAMQQDMLAGLSLPMKMLVYDDGTGQTWVAYEEVEDMFDDTDVDDDADFVRSMEDALRNLSGAAAGQ